MFLEMVRVHLRVDVALETAAVLRKVLIMRQVNVVIFILGPPT